MKENVGTADAIARGILGASLLAFGFTRGAKQRLFRRTSMLGPLLSVAAGSAIFQTALTRVCPVSRMLGIDTTGGFRFRRRGSVVV